MSEVKKKKKFKIDFLMQVSIVLFIMGLVCFILGVVYAFKIMSDNTLKMVYDDFEDMFVMSDFQQVTMCFFTGFVFLVWSCVLFIISRISKAKKQHELEEKQSETIVPVIQEVQKKVIVCAYCDSELDERERKCSHCGATKKVLK